MSDPYEKVKGGRLTFKGGSLASRSKSIDKKKHKKKNKNNNPKNDESEPSIPLDVEVEIQDADADAVAVAGDESGNAEGAPVVYTIDAAKRMKYEQLFPVETRKFGYDPKSISKSVEDALDDRVKKKADRYCK